MTGEGLLSVVRKVRVNKVTVVGKLVVAMLVVVVVLVVSVTTGMNWYIVSMLKLMS